VPQCQFLFSAVFGFRKVIHESFSELHGTNCKYLKVAKGSNSQKEGARGPEAGPHAPQARPSPWPRLAHVWPPPAASDSASSPIYSPPRENPKHPFIHPRKVPSPPQSRTLVREGSGALPGTLPEEKIIAGGLFIAMPASEVMRE
jgi:hypothetical protein